MTIFTPFFGRTNTMSVAQYADLLICPDYLADAARQCPLGLHVLKNQKAFLEYFSLNDAATLCAFNESEVIKRYLGEIGNPMRYFWGTHDDKEVTQYKGIRDLAGASNIRQFLDENYLQPAPADAAAKAYRIEDLGDGITLLIVSPGAIYAMRNDNYLMGVLRAITARMFQFLPFDQLVNDGNGSNALFKRYLNLAAFTNPNRPPQPVFA